MKIIEYMDGEILILNDEELIINKNELIIKYKNNISKINVNEIKSIEFITRSDENE